MNADRTLAIDVALLLPERVAARVVALNRFLSDARPDQLRLDLHHLPHLTLGQQFVTAARLPAFFARLGGICRLESPHELGVKGAVTRGETVTLVVERQSALQHLHESVMDTLAAFEETDGDRSSFFPGDEAIRPRDVEWVACYRSDSSFDRYCPHITVGHGRLRDPIEPFDFVADRLAVCHLGRHCSCRRILCEWRLGSPLPIGS